MMNQLRELRFGILLTGGCALVMLAGALGIAGAEAMGGPRLVDEPLVVSEREIPDAELLTSKILRERGLNARDVILFAHLDDAFRNHPDMIQPAAADGKALLNDYVMLENAEETAAFLKQHGYSHFRGPVGVRQWKTRIEVDVRITARNGKSMVITLSADGGRQGCG